MSGVLNNAYGNFIPRNMIVVGYYGFMLAVCVSVHLSYAQPSVFSFPDKSLSKCHVSCITGVSN